MTSGRDQHGYNVAYYATHREQEIERVIARQRATRDWLRSLKERPCVDCSGSFPPYVMDWDHRDPSAKSFWLASSRAMLKSRDELLAEIAKCDLVCANCHRARTHASFMAGDFQIPVPPLKERTPHRERTLSKFHETRAEQNALLIAYRSTPCFDCHLTFPWFVMEFDHRDPSTKRNAVPTLAGRTSLMRLLEEIEKCDILCANCHRVRTYLRREVARNSAGVL